ncbi:hypothetical protein, partial [Aureimonas sp. SK2]|uniref:hypothetical protein n=1 Tax=Aureimonas sp. SK2 TaxID=3015992 RepID=UPI0024441462
MEKAEAGSMRWRALPHPSIRLSRETGFAHLYGPRRIGSREEDMNMHSWTWGCAAALAIVAPAQAQTTLT